MNAAHHAKYRKEKEPELYQELRLLALEIRDHLAELDGWRQTAVYDQNHIEEVRGQLFSIEGRAAHKFNVTAKPLWLRPVLANRRLPNAGCQPRHPVWRSRPRQTSTQAKQLRFNKEVAGNRGET